MVWDSRGVWELWYLKAGVCESLDAWELGSVRAAVRDSCGGGVRVCVCMSVCLFVCFVCLYVCMYVYMYVCLYVCMSLFKALLCSMQRWARATFFLTPQSQFRNLNESLSQFRNFLKKRCSATATPQFHNRKFSGVFYYWEDFKGTVVRYFWPLFFCESYWVIP